MIENSLSLSGDPGFGLTMGMRESASTFDSIGFAVASCKCGEQAFRIMQRYQRITTYLAEIIIDKTEQHVAYCSRPTYPTEQFEPFIVENAYASCVQFSRRIFQDESLHPVEVNLRYPEPSYRDRYDTFFRCPVRFNCADNRLIINREYVNRPFPTHNPDNAEMAMQFCERLLSEQPSDDLVSKIRRHLVATPSRFPSMTEVAQEIGISEQTLRRSLKECDTTFQNIFDDIRKKITIEYLKNSDLTLEDIAELIGFGSAGNFHRAFKKWTGKSPTAFRRRVL
jgi:AraC-like DNA-binding protein